MEGLAQKYTLDRYTGNSRDSYEVQWRHFVIDVENVPLPSPRPPPTPSEAVEAALASMSTFAKHNAVDMLAYLQVITNSCFLNKQ